MTPPLEKFVLVYDVGGSHISAALCTEGTYALLGIAHAPLPADGLNTISSHDPAGNPAFRFVRLIHALGMRAITSAEIPAEQVIGAGLAMPGPFDYENGISQMRHKLQSLFGVDLKAAVAARFGWQPSQIGFVNDAGAFLLGEAGAGAAKGFPRSIGITLGTGIGCAFAIDGRIAMPSGEIEDGASSSNGVPPGGEIWNLPYNGATVEDFVSTRFLRSRYQALTGIEADVSAVAAIAQCLDDQPCVALDEALAKQVGPTPEDKAILTSGSSAPPSAATRPTTKNAAKSARQAFDDFGQHLGLALNQHAAPFEPDVIVLGGGISRAANLFLPATRKALTFPVEIVISSLMDQAPLAGAGVSWFTTGRS